MVKVGKWNRVNMSKLYKIAYFIKNIQCRKDNNK